MPFPDGAGCDVRKKTFLKIAFFGFFRIEENVNEQKEARAEIMNHRLQSINKVFKEKSLF
jgi:hypothetical protein